jgi:hypothetical protein
MTQKGSDDSVAKRSGVDKNAEDYCRLKAQLSCLIVDLGNHMNGLEETKASLCRQHILATKVDQVVLKCEHTATGSLIESYASVQESLNLILESHA